MLAAAARASVLVHMRVPAHVALAHQRRDVHRLDMPALESVAGCSTSRQAHLGRSGVRLQRLLRHLLVLLVHVRDLLLQLLDHVVMRLERALRLWRVSAVTSSPLRRRAAWRGQPGLRLGGIVLSMLLQAACACCVRLRCFLRRAGKRRLRRRAQPRCDQAAGTMGRCGSVATSVVVVLGLRRQRRDAASLCSDRASNI